jgi:sugar phosphate isomerase/epimerase
MVAMLGRLPHRVDAIVVHPDAIGSVELYRSLGRKLAIENMDVRKSMGQTAAELAALFGELPDAGLCFDVAHAKSVDPTMAEGERILDSFGDRLRHVHLSSLDSDCHHVPLTERDESLFAPLLSRCRDVPWILEAPTGS